MIFSFVILHYNTVAETVKCVDSIKKLVGNSIDIVIVDNASPNKSGLELFSLYQEDDHVVVLLCKENLGFAKGNNVGINYARKYLNSDFVVVLNNDTYMVQRNFLDVVEEEWKYSHFAVLGPKIHTFANLNPNPIAEKFTTTSAVAKAIRHNRYQKIRVYLGVDGAYEKIKYKVKKMFGLKRKHLKKKEELDNVRQENVKLHGCCYVFSPVFFSHFDGFDSRTFMYAEEDILYVHIKIKGLLMVYNPKLEIFHAEMVATKASSKNLKKMKLFRLRESIKSLKVLKSILCGK